MNKEILKRNIEQVIMQPCIANPWNKNSKEVRQNGLSDDGKEICVKTTPNDTSSVIWLERNGEKCDYVQDILNKLPPEYRDHLVTLRHDPKWICNSYLPVFDTDTQAKWDKELYDYVSDKAAWCERYGCD